MQYAMNVAVVNVGEDSLVLFPYDFPLLFMPELYITRKLF